MSTTKKREFNMDMLKTKKLLNRQEAAFYIGVSPATMHTLMHSEDFPAFVRVTPNRVFVNREILDQWIDERSGKK